MVQLHRFPPHNKTMSDDTFDPAERARQKAAAREQDRLDLESGRKTREQLRKENGAFGFPPGSVRIDFTRIKGR